LAAELHSDDAALVRSLRSGDERVFFVLVKRLQPRLVAMARRILGADADAEDVVQEAWRRVVAGLSSFEGRSRLETWIFQITINCARTRAASRRERVARDEDIDPLDGQFTWYGSWAKPIASWETSSITPESATFERELRGLIDGALDLLPEQQRMVVFMRDVEGTDAEATAEALGVSLANQRVLLHRGRARLRQLVAAALEKQRA
jgi:RNA polymerase sigma-70 factor, ECF subfamily